MEQRLILLCKYSESITAITIFRSWTYAQLLSMIRSKWEDEGLHQFRLRYSFPGVSNCMLDNDDDLQTLFDLAEANNIKQVDMVVVVDSAGSSVVNDLVQDESQRQWSLEYERSSNMLSSFVSHQENVLLSSHWSNGITDIGQIFEGGVRQFRTTLCKYAIELGFEFVYVKNEKDRVTAQCKFRERCCEWMIHGRTMLANGYFYVKKLNKIHTCGAAVRTSKNSRMTSNLVGGLIEEEVRSKLHKRPIDVMHDFKSKYGIDISYHMSWLGVEKARGEIYGDYSKSFDRLRWFVDAVKESNPGSAIDLEFDPTSYMFKRMFIAFKGCIDGFNYCRPLLFLDGTFLKGRYKGHLLSATAKDGDHGLFPVCFAIVDAENIENWNWFMKNLAAITDVGREFTLVSDRNLGLLDAVANKFPNAHHSYCIQHLKNNLRHQLRGHKNAFRERMVVRFLKCAYAPTKEVFNQFVEELLREGGSKVKAFIDDIPPEHWSNAYFSGRRFGEMTSNAAESFNNWIKDVRQLPITNMIDRIRIKLMDQMATRRSMSSKWSNELCPMVDAKLYKAYNESRTWIVSTSTDDIYEVECFPSASVDFKKGCCTCCQWQLIGIACAHVVAAAMKSGKSLNAYVDKYYHASSYRASYSSPIYPVPTMWSQAVDDNDCMILPPICKRQPGRPRKKRIPSQGENVSQITCGRCGRLGRHNRKTCKEPIGL